MYKQLRQYIVRDVFKINRVDLASLVLGPDVRVHVCSLFCLLRAKGAQELRRLVALEFQVSPHCAAIGVGLAARLTTEQLSGRHWRRVLIPRYPRRCRRVDPDNCNQTWTRSFALGSHCQFFFFLVFKSCILGNFFNWIINIIFV